MSVIAITGKMDSGRTCLETKRKSLLEGHGGHRFMVINAPECKHYSSQLLRTVICGQIKEQPPDYVHPRRFLLLSVVTRTIWRGRFVPHHRSPNCWYCPLAQNQCRNELPTDYGTKTKRKPTSRFRSPGALLPRNADRQASA